MTRGRVDWLRMEDRLRKTLADLRHDCGGDWDKLSRDAMSAALFAIDDTIGNETGRGYPLDWAQGETPCR